ncbi:MAG: CHAT domain-containing protein [Myxococcota bacterium]|nr:CHAT domain-containing protein [Myxococcota bacterium]
MFSLILSLMLACGGEGTDPEQEKAEQEQKAKEKKRKADLRKVESLTGNGYSDKAFEKGLAYLKSDAKNKDVQILLEESALTQSDQEAARKRLEDAKVDKNLTEILSFYILLGAADKSEALKFAQEVSNKEISQALQIQALRAGAVMSSSEDSFVQAALDIIKGGTGDALAGLDELKEWRAQIEFVKLAHRAKRPDLVEKYTESLKKSKEAQARAAILSILGQNGEREALVEAFELMVQKGMAREGRSLVQNVLRRQGSADLWGALTEARDLDKAVQKGTWERLSMAQAALSLGRYSAALKLSSAAAKSMEKSPNVQRANYLMGLSAFLVRDVPTLKKAAEGTKEHKNLFNGLLKLSMGEAMPLDSFDGLTGRNFVYMVLYTAGNDAGVAETHLPKAIEEAQKLGDPILNLATRFLQESYLRNYKGEDTTALLTSLDETFGAQFPNIKGEVLVRKYLQKAPELNLDLPEGASEVDQAWKTYISDAIPNQKNAFATLLASMQIVCQKKGYETFINTLWKKIPIHRIGPLRTGTVLDGSNGLLFDQAVRKMIGTTKIEEAATAIIFQDLARRGELLQKDAWSSRNPVMGMEPQNREALIDAVAQSNLGMLYYWTGKAFPYREFEVLDKIEARLLMSKDEADRLAFEEEKKRKEAVIKQREEEKAKAKTEDVPKKDDEKKEADSKKDGSEDGESAKAKSEEAPKKDDKKKEDANKDDKKKPKEDPLAVLLKSLSYDSSYRTLALNKNIDLNSLQEQIYKIALISYRIDEGDVIGVGFSDHIGQVLNLGSAEKLLSTNQEHLDNLRSSIEKPEIYAVKADTHRLADQMRKNLLEPFTETVSKYMRYVIIAPEPLSAFSFNTFPEQQNGMRFLGGIRYISASTGVSELLRSSKFRNNDMEIIAVSKETESKEESDLLRTGKAGQPIEIDQISLSFKPDKRKVLIADEAKMGVYRKHVSAAKYIYFAQASSTSDGGFFIGEEKLSLSEISSTPLNAQIVIISEHPDHRVQMRRVRAFLNAGARNVLVMDWSIPDKQKRAVLDKVFESLMREEPITVAIQKVVKSNLGTSNVNSQVRANSPGIWGSLHLYGFPDMIGN